jgi:hypothetical protein
MGLCLLPAVAASAAVCRNPARTVPPTPARLQFILTQPGDWFSNVNSLRRAGFQGQSVDTDEMFLRQLKEMREQKVIP